MLSPFLTSDKSQELPKISELAVQLW